MDPLYHQTSAQFDEGGARGLLLNNLGVYSGCRVIFDSFECPDKIILSEPLNHSSEVIDLSFAKGMETLFKRVIISSTLYLYNFCHSCFFKSSFSFADIIEQMMTRVPVKNDISPTLRDIVNQFDEDNRRPSDAIPMAQQPIVQEDADDYEHSEVEGNTFDDCQSWNVDHNDDGCFGHDDPTDSFTSTDAYSSSHPDVSIINCMPC